VERLCASTDTEAMVVPISKIKKNPMVKDKDTIFVPCLYVAISMVIISFPLKA
jgi:hypothetical protein